MRTYIRITSALIVTTIMGFNSISGAQPHINGEVALLSHHVENGLSQTQKSPALHAAFWLNLSPQFRFGIQGSNVYYKDSDDRFNLKVNADLLIPFNETSHLSIAFYKSFFFNQGHRNTDITAFHLAFGNLKIGHETYTDWEGTDEKTKRLSLSYEHKFVTQLIWKNSIGFNDINDKNFENFYDLKSSLGKYWGRILVEGAVTGTTTPDQLNNRGDIFLILSLSTEI